MNMKKKLGLIGYPLSHSFSKKYFTKKFEKENISDYEYLNFECKNLDNFPAILQQNPALIGLNVTMPYKEKILQYVDVKDPTVKKIGASNTLLIQNGHITAYNTDVYAFKESLLPLLEQQHQKALILGTGGASKAVKYVLNELNIEYTSVSRQAKNNGEISYNELTKSIISSHLLVINTTPVGSYPDIKKSPLFPYDFISPEHLFYDLIYNPLQTIFLQKALIKGAKVSNGLKMLQLQAEKSWEIWQKKTC